MTSNPFMLIAQAKQTVKIFPYWRPNDV